MLIHKIKYFANKTPEKQAVVYKGKSATYGELWSEIKQRTIGISKIAEKNLLLSKSNEYENLVNFLAGLAIEKASIFVSKHQNESQLNELQKKNSAFLIDNKFEFDSYDIESPIQETAVKKHKTNNKQQQSTLFLGVLTSGTTNTPNLIWKDYQSWFTAFPHQSSVFGIDETNKLFVLDALSYSANLNSVLHMLWLGGTVVLTSIQTANTWAQQIEKEQISSIFMVPSHYRLLLQTDPNLGQIKSILSAGEKLDQATAEGLLKAAPNALLTEYYGSAELGHITFHQGNDIISNPLSVGKAFPEVNIKLKNDQIFVESPYISPEYRKKSTNFDLGYFIDDALILVGRAGRMFNRRGLNIFAEEIENVVKKLPYIFEAAAVGILKADNSHNIFLAYSCKNEFKNNTYNSQIIKYLANHLQATKIPQRLLEFENLPRTTFGKIDFKALARTFEEAIFA